MMHVCSVVQAQLLIYTKKLSLRVAVEANWSITASILGVSDQWIVAS